MVETLWILVLLAVLAFLLYKVFRLKSVTIFEHQKGLKYSHGRHAGVLGAGQYWILPAFNSIVPVDIRPEFVTVPSQDVISADGVTLKISLAAEYEVADPNQAINKTANYRTALYLTLQMALRELVTTDKIDDLMQNRATIGKKLMESSVPKAKEYGLNLKLVDVKDVMFTGEMKRAYAQVVKAQKEGQAALERARGETAALRNLANAARVMDDNPNLLQLRALQAFSESPGNTMVFGLPNSPIPVTKQKPKNATDVPKEQEERRD